jgi:hypothetical protein
MGPTDQRHSLAVEAGIPAIGGRVTATTLERRRAGVDVTCEE